MPMVATMKPYTLFVVDDDMPLNPRTDYDNLGKMVCWHSRYNLGDEHDYDEPRDFLQKKLFEMYSSYPSSQYGKPIYDFIKSGKAETAKLEYDRSAHEWVLYEKWFGGNEWSKSSSYPASLKGKEVPDWFLDDCLSALEHKELLQLLEQSGKFVILPLYLYDHSGITMNTTGFSCPWDSGQVGWIYADADCIKKEYGKVTPETINCNIRMITIWIYTIILKTRRNWIMKYDGENAYVLFACNLHKERNSMRMIAVAADKVTLYAIIGNEVLHGNMDYKGYAKQKGFNLLREDYKRGEISSANLDYGYIEETAVIEHGYANMSSEIEKVYNCLNMEDSEYESLGTGEQLKGIPDDRLRLILDKALMSVANDYRCAELYEHLHTTLGKSDEEITKAGFDLREFYAEYDFDNTEDNEQDLEV